jgi:hypothetical protein
LPQKRSDSTPPCTFAPCPPLLLTSMTLIHNSFDSPFNSRSVSLPRDFVQRNNHITTRTAIQPTLFHNSKGGPPLYIPAGTRCVDSLSSSSLDVGEINDVEFLSRRSSCTGARTYGVPTRSSSIPRGFWMRGCISIVRCSHSFFVAGSRKNR